MVFEKDQRTCKRRELSIKIITAALTIIYTGLDDCFDVEILAGRKYKAF
jgi:hypothetical protein